MTGRLLKNIPERSAGAVTFYGALVCLARFLAEIIIFPTKRRPGAEAPQ